MFERTKHMLVLRRKAGEAIVLNGVIKIHILAIEGERVKVGIDAPPDVLVVREELLTGQTHESGNTGYSKDDYK
jgi:carbon storage regulator